MQALHPLVTSEYGGRSIGKFAMLAPRDCSAVLSRIVSTYFMKAYYGVIAGSIFKSGLSR